MQIINKYFPNLNTKKTNLLIKYSEILIDYNKNINLTGEKDLNNFIKNQIIDSLQGFEYMKKFKNKKILDIGTGGGIPGIPLAILSDENKFYLVDSKTKKTVFLKDIKKKLNLNNVHILNKNILEIKEKFDIITAKAFGSIEKIIKLTKHCRTKNTLYFLYKGKREKIEQELNNVKNKIFNKKVINVNNKYTQQLKIERNFVLFNTN